MLMAENGVMNPTNDYIFKRIFGQHENIDRRFVNRYNKFRKINEAVKK